MSISLQNTGVDHKEIQGRGGDICCDFWDTFQVSLVKNIQIVESLIGSDYVS